MLPQKGVTLRQDMGVREHLREVLQVLTRQAQEAVPDRPLIGSSNGELRRLGEEAADF